jgi:hypothetical protein
MNQCLQLPALAFNLSLHEADRVGLLAEHRAGAIQLQLQLLTLRRGGSRGMIGRRRVWSSFDRVFGAAPRWIERSHSGAREDGNRESLRGMERSAASIGRGRRNCDRAPARLQAVGGRETKAVDLLIQFGGQPRQILTGLRCLVGGCSHVIRDLADAGQRLADLFARGCLLGRGSGDHRDLLFRTATKGDDGLKRLKRPLALFQPRADAALAFVHSAQCLVRLGLDGGDRVRDLFGGRSGALSEPAHFTGYDSKAPAVLSSTLRLNVGVERQQIRLLGDIFDRGHDVADLFGPLRQRRHPRHRLIVGAADTAHSFSRLFDHRAALAGSLGSSTARGAGMLRIL